MGKCKNKDCGCQNGQTTPAPCPPSTPCGEYQPCSSYTDAQCIIYTGEDIECNGQVVVETNALLNDIIIELVSRICELENQIRPFSSPTPGDLVGDSL